jgi:hypothetical protein
LKLSEKRIFCIGAAKTGSTSLADLLSPYLRSYHEPEAETTNHTIIKYLCHRLSKSELCRFIIRRDRRLNANLESGHNLVYILDVLLELVPSSQFILTIRDPRLWIISRLSYYLQVNPSIWTEYRDCFWRNRRYYAPESCELSSFYAKFGIPSPLIFLEQYADHYRRVFSSIPSNKMLVVKTEQLDKSMHDIIAFLGLDFQVDEMPRSNRGESSRHLFPPHIYSKLIESSEMICGDIVDRYYS